MTSKYDTYWQNKLDVILDLLAEARSGNQSEPLDVSDIEQHGVRQNWYGRLEIAHGQPVYTYGGTHVESLARVLTPRLPSWASTLVWSLTISSERQLVVQQVTQQATTWFDAAYRAAKLAETVMQAETYLGAITATETEAIYVRSQTGKNLYVMFCTKADGWLAPRVSHVNQLAAEDGRLLFSFTEEAAGTICLWDVPLRDLVARVQAEGLQPTREQGNAYSFNIVPGESADLIKQLRWDIRPFRLTCSPTELTRAQFTPPLVQQAQNIPVTLPVKSEVNTLARLDQWKQEATDPQHSNFVHANLDDAVRRYATISILLTKLRTAPDSFTEDDALLLFGTLNSGQRTKNKVVEQNSLPVLRQTLLELVDGKGSASARIETATAAIRFAGMRMLGELYGWAHADTAPLYNSCATEALAYLGYSFDPDDYNAFVAAHEQFKQVYQQHVGHLRPDLPLNLEIDKLYNVIDKVDLKETRQERRLADPFNEMFRDWDEAQWAFDLLAQAANRLSLKGPDDPMAAFNLRRIGREYQLRFTYGGWLVMALAGRAKAFTNLALILFADQDVIEPQRTEPFSQNGIEKPVALQWISAEVARTMPEPLMDTYLATLDYVKEVYAGWTRSNFHISQKHQIAKAVFSQSDRERLLEQGLKTPAQQFWKIAPGQDAWNWNACRQGGFIAIGWDELGDLAGVDRSIFETRCQEFRAANPETTQETLEQVWQFLQIQEGDQVIANQGTTKILGIGTVNGPYYYVPDVRHRHRLPVSWDDTTPRTVDQPGWQRTLIELDAAKFEQLTRTPPIEPPQPLPLHDSVFSLEAFELLAGLHANPTKEYYLSRKDAFKTHVEEPFQAVLHEVAKLLPPQIQAVMETDEHVFARFLKNDYGKGGAWDFYWGAFYPKGGKRTEDAQLSLWMNQDRLEYGFYIGAYGSDQRKRFQSNCREHGSVLAAYFKEILPEDEVAFGDHDNFEVDPEGNVQAKIRFTWDDFLRDPARASNDVSIILPRPRVIATSRPVLVQQMKDAFVRLFPLVLLATDDNPLAAINRFWRAQGIIENGEPPKPVQTYSHDDFLDRTYFLQKDANELGEMLQDKRQVILYGPPGTGKTFVAQELAKWLTGLADPPADRVEMIQFHPAYGYEDFIEGIRPESKLAADGHFVVDYPARAGVFRRFCINAEQSPDNQPCVFIIDEINRGNIARIFGELMLLLEYRNREVPLPYSGKRFRIPDNVYLIGTMNTADRSIALVDFALRRRFHFFHFRADHELFERWLAVNPVDVPYLADLYFRLSQEAVDDPNYAVGPSYFMDPTLTEQKLERIWRRSIEPYLAEYYVDQRAKLNRWRWDSDFMKGVRAKL